MENEYENIDSSNDTDAEQQIDHSLDADAKVKALAEQNKKLFARAKRAEGFIQNPDGHWVKKQRPSEKEEVIINKTEPLKPLDILRDEAFKLYREGYDETDIDIIIKNGGRKILEDKNNPITLGLERKREQLRAEDASNQINGNGGGYVDTERKVTLDQLKNMTVEEMKKVLPHA